MVLIFCDVFVSVLQKKAEKFELKKLQVLKLTRERVSALESLLQDVYGNRRPKPIDYEVRRDLIRVFNEIAKEIYGNLLASCGFSLPYSTFWKKFVSCIAICSFSGRSLGSCLPLV